MSSSRVSSTARKMESNFTDLKNKTMTKDLYTIPIRYMDDLPSMEKETHEEYLSKLDFYKKVIDNDKKEMLNKRLIKAIENERYELANYIKQKISDYVKKEIL